MAIPQEFINLAKEIRDVKGNKGNWGEVGELEEIWSRLKEMNWKAERQIRGRLRVQARWCGDYFTLSGLRSGCIFERILEIRCSL